MKSFKQYNEAYTDAGTLKQTEDGNSKFFKSI